MVVFILFYPASSFAKDKVILQLSQDHQFQFAGYYAAQWQGYYNEAGLNVDILSAVTPKKFLSAVEEVGRGRAHFGIGATDILKARDDGLPLVLVASIFQHSAARFYTRGDTIILSPAGFLNLKVARRVNDLIDMEFQTLLRAEGINPDRITPYPHQPGIDHLVSGQVDVIPGYSINIPFTAKTRGISINEFLPIQYGIDFYGDSIFTREDIAQNQPDLVTTFKQASIKGWEYALTHKAEMVNKICRTLKRGRPINDPAAFNTYQSNGMFALTHFPEVEIGHVNPNRWEKINNYLIDIGVVSSPSDTIDYIFNPELTQKTANKNRQSILIMTIAIITFCMVIGMVWLRTLQTTVKKRTREIILSNRKLKASQTKYRLLFEHGADAIFILDPDSMTILESNTAASVLYGYSTEEFRNMTAIDLSAEPQKSSASVTQIKKGEKIHVPLRRHRKKDGTKFPVEGHAYTVTQEEKKVTYLVIRDITEKKKSEDALKASEELHRITLSNISDTVLITDNRGVFTFICPNVDYIFGYSEDEVKAMGRLPELLGVNLVDSGDLSLVKEVKNQELTIKDKAGAAHDLLINIKQVDIQGGTIMYTCRDISALKNELHLNRAVADISKALLSEVYEIKNVSDVTLDYAKELTGSKFGFVSSIDKLTLDNVGHTMTDMFGDACKVKDQGTTFPIGENNKYGGLWGHALNTRKAFFTNTPDTHPSTTGLPQGHILLKNFLAVPVVMGDHLRGLIALANCQRSYSEQDIIAIQRVAEVFALALHRADYETERQEMEQNLRQLQKNEAIGALAGGIAHDFNNILFPIVGFAEMLEEDLAGDKRFHKYIAEILSGAKRAKELVRQILTFSRQTDQEVIPLQPNLIIKEVTKLIKSTIPSTIQIRQEIDKSCHTIMADPTQIHQVVMNLVTNAFHAMDESGGTLTITLANIDISEGSPEFSSLAPGSYVLFSIEDTGTGMESHIMEKIFNPYYTTKPKGKGTGLGLSVVHGIITNYGGDIFVSSSRNKGTTFKVCIPAVEKEPGRDLGKDLAEIPRGSGNIMLVDDELPILRIEELILHRLGYDTDTFSRSEEALARIQSHPHAYDLVITDMTMPELTGDRLTMGIKEINPDLPVIICTGFSEKISPEKAEAIGAQGLLYKPVIKTDMARMLAQVLGTTGEKG